MKLRILLPGILAALAVLGLLMTPIARLAAAMPGGMMDMAGAAAAMDMPADMPCCPDEAPVTHCTQDCPFIALCVMGTALSLPATTVVQTPLDARSRLDAGNDSDFTSLHHDPPLRPPQA